MRKLSALLLAAAVALPMSALAKDAGPVRGNEVRRVQVPVQLRNAQRSDYMTVFAALRAQDWYGAAARLDAMGDGPLHDVARAQLYTAKGSPVVGLPELMNLLVRSPELPQAEQLARLARTRGAETLPHIPQAQRLVGLAGQPRRSRARGVRGDSLAAELEPVIQKLIVDRQPGEAERLLEEQQFGLSPEALAEFQQRIAWSHYLNGNDRAARQLAQRARSGHHEWGLHAEWVHGLASWRMGDCQNAGESFSRVGSGSRDVELMAAGHYWASRAEMKCGRPQSVQAHLRAAARLNETFYGLIASSALGLKATNVSGLHDYRDAEWGSVIDKANVRAAFAALEIGETRLADELIRHQARLGNQSDHNALLHLAYHLNLTTTQVWLAHNAPRGATVNIAARYPMPDWQPPRGWRVDPALVFAHALQESGFRPEAVSPAGARGLMQVMPGTARDISRRTGLSADAGLNDPITNVEFGQTYIEYLRDLNSTGGLLPKVIAAYNAGPAPLSDWNSRSQNQHDPLLYIESIPYWETRGYVPIVMRNYWIYEQKAGRQSTSRAALAQGMWPRFPGMAGPTAIRMEQQQPQQYSAAMPGTGHSEQ
jgi:soluble lytic murein transglycosylase